MGASSSKSVSASKEYEVFISFRGEETRHNFISHLFSALSRKSIKAYKDSQLNRGDEISTSLIRAIRDSYGSLVVFSENYASSKWCLNELLQILECRKQGHFVIPVFYNVDPSHVRNQTATYGEAFAEHEKDSKNKDKLQLWKTALTEAANIAGWDSQSLTNRDESEFIENIVNDILQKMNHIYQPTESGFVGIDKCCEDIELLLQRSPLVGIWGMGGVGKTTIAKVVFGKLFSQYDNYYFYENIREESDRKGLNCIRNKLLSELLKENFNASAPKTLAFEFAMRRLSRKKVLIVLDDVGSKQLEYLKQECNCLGSNSKVIITTRDKHVLAGIGADQEIYEVKGLDFQKSLQLFKLNAFNEKYRDTGYEEISKEFVYYAKGLPLALKVLGSFLCSKSKEEWESALAKLKKFPNNEIHEVLKLSYDELDYAEKQIFLDIACFFKGEHVEDVISLLDRFEFFGCIGIRSLKDKALVTIGYGGRLHMHDLIQEMGWNIVRCESINNPERRSRLWDPEEVFHVLNNNKGTDAVEGIMLNMSQIRDMSLKIDTFKKMPSLRFLKFHSSYFSDKSSKIYLPEGIGLFSDKLRYFHWDHFPCFSLPSTFCVEKLVELRLPRSHITKLWDGRQDVVNLKKIDLSGCHQLIELSDLSNASKLEWAYLSECTNLRHIHPSILHLDSLVGLFVDDCKKLTSLRSESHLRSLRKLNLEGCSSLKEFSLSAENIKDLWFEGTAIDIVPSSIGRCGSLETLGFHDRPKKFPSKISKSTSLKIFNIWKGSEFDSSDLHVMFDAFPCLEKLCLIKCVKLFQLPDNISVLSSLTELDLSESSVESLPTSIKHLSYLTRLDVSDCQKLRSLPELPPSLITLVAKNCSILEILIPSTALQFCDLENCVKLDQQSLNGVMAAVHHRVMRAEQIKICWPADTIPQWFSYRTTRSRISMELPQHFHLLGFVLSLTFSDDVCGVKCVCCLEDSEILEYASERYRWMANNVYLCYDHRITDSLNALEKGVCHEVSFQIYLKNSVDLDTVVKEFGVWPIYATELEVLELRDKSNRIRFGLEADEQQQLPLTKIPLEFELDLNTESCSYLDTSEIKTKGSGLENQDEETVLIDKKIPGEFIFQQLPIESTMPNDSNVVFDFFTESGLGDTLKRCWCESNVDEQQPSLAKKFKESTLQSVPLGLELELTMNSHTHFEIEGIQVGSSNHEKQDEQEPNCTEKGIQGI